MQSHDTRKKRLKELIYSNRYLFLQAYWLLYLPWFAYLEKTVTNHFHIIHMKLDDYIPFLPVFVIPYFLWFGYVAVAFVNIYLHDKNKKEYIKTCQFLFTGMTVFLIASTIYPNGHLLRNSVTLDNGFFCNLIRELYQTDTSTNLFPSIHVFNSIGAHIAICRSENWKHSKVAKNASFMLMISIILSTMFIKQHSVFDVLTALLMAFILYQFVYGRAGVDAIETARETGKRSRRKRRYEF